MKIKTVELIVRPVKAVQFTGEPNETEDLRNWIQDKLSFQQVTATNERLYLPSVGGMEILVVGDWVLFDEQDRVFRGATDDAIKAYYREIPEAPVEPEAPAEVTEG